MTWAVSAYLLALAFWTTSSHIATHRGSVIARVGAVAGLAALTALPVWLVLLVVAVLR